MTTDASRPAPGRPPHAHRVVVVGLGSSGRAAVEHLRRRGVEVVAVDDDPGERTRAVAHELGVDLLQAPAPSELARVVAGADEVVVSPGVPASHPVFSLPGDVPRISEVELAWRACRIPVVAVTGTNGKTTVVTLVTEMLRASGVAAEAAGNIGRPFAQAVDDPGGRAGPTEVFVVEVSSFQLALTHRFRPAVGAWLNFGEDHLDWHPDLEHYRAAKARLWANAGPGDVAVANVEDPVVADAAESARRRGATVRSFGLHTGDWRTRRAGSDLVLSGPQGDVVSVGDLPRHHPHDLVDALCGLAAATAVGATLEGSRRALLDFRGLPHRVQLVGEANGVQFYDDSKATTPGAVLAALSGFDSAVLIAGGRNKGLDLGVLSEGAPRLRAVVAIGEAAPEVRAAFAGLRPVRVADTMSGAVAAAASLARPGDAVVLSPACASFDWYASYAERGDDFARCVAALVDAAGGSPGGGSPGGGSAGGGGAADDAAADGSATEVSEP